VKILLDTNILVRMAERTSPDHALVMSALATVLSRGDEPVVTAQALIEFWVVATRPANVNGLGWTPAQAHGALTGFLGQFAQLDDVPSIFPHWLGLVTANTVEGKRSHDARLAAVLLAHGLTTVLTLNVRDFSGFPGITPVHPRDV
jgi:predicted nucleic acid-binding protein